MRITKKSIGNIIITVVLMFIFLFDLFSLMEFRLQDAQYQRPGTIDSPDIFVFGIDVQSQDEFGPFQHWSRQIMADAVNILNRDKEYSPAVIAIDISFIGESSDKTADENLAAAAENGGNVVLVCNALFDSSNATITALETPYPSLAKFTTYGLSNAIFEKDNVIRFAPLKIRFQGETVYSFPYEVYKKFTGEATNEFVEANNEAYITYYQKPGGYYGAEGFGLSFSDIFQDDFEPEYFADCIVFIGPYSPGMMDAYTTPVSSEQMYGVEIHANVTQMLLEGNFKTHIPRVISLIILLALIILTFLVGQKTDIRIFLLILTALSVIYVILALWIFAIGYISMLIYPIFSFAAIYVYQLVYGYVLEAMEKQKVKSAFKKYVDPKLVDKLMETGEANNDEIGAKKDIAVLFVDVRGFTPMTEALKDQPELIVSILNEYLELTSTAVFNNGGSVDKFIGDATMALFNGFVPLPDYEYKAVKAAWDIVQGASAVNASIKEKYNVDVGFGVGVNCGEAIVGNIGPSFRKDYTAIGDTVNTAARLESNAKRSQVLISKQVYDKVKDRIEAASVGEIPLKGKSIKLEVFSVENVF